MARRPDTSDSGDSTGSGYLAGGDREDLETDAGELAHIVLPADELLGVLPSDDGGDPLL